MFIACTPSGGAAFISKVHEGAISDKEITKKSGFLENIEPGDVVLADRGFDIDDLLCEKGARLVIPAFMEKRDALPIEDEIETRIIAKARIHIERFNQRMKTFLFVKGPVPQCKLCYLTQAVYVCAILANLSPILAK